MDTERRQQLEARRKALRATSSRPPRDSHITAALNERGVPFEVSQSGLWTPPYLAISSSRIDWPRSPPVAEYVRLKELAERVSRVRALVERVTFPGDWLHFYYEYHYTSLEIAQEEAIGAIDLLLDSEFEIWITAKPRNWLIELNRSGDVRLALPPTLSAEDVEIQARRQRAYVGAMVEPFRAAGVEVGLFSRDDPAAPELLRGVVMNHWRERKRTVGLPLNKGDHAGLAVRLRGVLDHIAPQATMIAYDLGYHDAPIVTLPIEDALDHPELLMAPIYADDEYRPIELMINEFVLFPLDGSWAIKVVVDGPRWKVESTADKV